MNVIITKLLLLLGRLLLLALWSGESSFSFIVVQPVAVAWKNRMGPRVVDGKEASWSINRILLPPLDAAKKMKRANGGGGGGGGGGFGGGFGTPTATSQRKKPTSNEEEASSSSLRHHHHQNGRLERISVEPLIYVMDNFLDAAACRAACRDETARMNTDIHWEFYQKVSRVLFDGQQSARDGLKFNSALSSSSLSLADDLDDDHDDDDDETAARMRSLYPDGLHVDTNNGEIFRHVTCILYLNDVPPECGGATVFPLARRCASSSNDPALLAASQRLLSEDIGHTRSCGLVRRQGIRRQADADLLESRGGRRRPTTRTATTTMDDETTWNDNDDDDTAIRIQPKAGRLCIFFTRQPDGSIDPRSWHGGERIESLSNPPMNRKMDRSGEQHDDGKTIIEKHILTLFKQVDYGLTAPMVETTFEAFLAPQIMQQRQSLAAKCTHQKNI